MSKLIPFLPKKGDKILLDPLGHPILPKAMKDKLKKAEEEKKASLEKAKEHSKFLSGLPHDIDGVPGKYVIEISDNGDDSIDVSCHVADEDREKPATYAEHVGYDIAVKLLEMLGGN